MSLRPPPTFRRATDEDLAAIEVWLRREDDRTGEGFFCNWNIIRNLHGDGTLFVVDVEGDPVAFLASEKADHLIAEVRPDQRGRGYGRMIAEAMVAQSTAHGLSVIEIACAPETSAPFWQRMGFTPVPSRRGLGGGVYAYREIPRRQGLGRGRRVQFAVRYYTERAHHGGASPFRIYEAKGELLGASRLRLPERATCYEPRTESLSDCYVEIEVAGRILIRDKTKRDEARALGINRDAAGVPYIEAICLSADLYSELREDGA